MVYFSAGDQIVKVTINGDGLKFEDIGEKSLIAPNFSYLNVIKEFPDLKDDEQWREKAFQRFKEYFLNIEGDFKKMDYIRQELKKQGYAPMYWEKDGFRKTKFKEL